MDQTIEKKKRRFNSKGKGNNFEGQVAKKLSDALTPLKFIRTPGSGARVGGKNFETLGQLFGEDALKLFVGDVVPVNEKENKVIFNFSVECKSYKTPDNFESLMSGSANIFKWMRESIDDSNKTKKIPLLIFKWNHTPIYVGMLKEHADSFNSLSKHLSILKEDIQMDIFYFDNLLKLDNFWIKDNE